MEFSARYVPAERGIGGDWYDVFTVPSGDLWVVMGDVAGHGLRAAVEMGRTRAAIRAYALQGRDPDEIFTLADENLQHFYSTELATTVCAVFPPPFDEACLSTAGHPPPVIASPGVPSGLIELDPDPPLGCDIGAGRHSTTVALPPGSLLFFYTDGLVERRGTSLDVRLKQLCAAVSADEPLAVCHRVMGILVGADEPQDDIAILAVRRSGGSA
jgi:serine phosphatase RsbU (regulator of sigma subunit)